jgi:hypothetical protein
MIAEANVVKDVQQTRIASYAYQPKGHFFSN